MLGSPCLREKSDRGPQTPSFSPTWSGLYLGVIISPLSSDQGAQGKRTGRTHQTINSQPKGALLASEVSTIITPISLMKKLRLKEVKYLVSE